jgi:hypothetical protein
LIRHSDRDRDLLPLYQAFLKPTKTCKAEMNPGHRDGWPPSQAGVSGQNQQQTDQPQGQGPRLPGIFGYVFISSSQGGRKHG